MPTIEIPNLTERNKIGVDVNYPLSGVYLQTAEINGTAGVLVIGTGTGVGRFSGTYNGGNFKTINVTINAPTSDYKGLFGSCVGATITGIADVTGSVTGKDYVGMIGRNFTSAVSLCKCSAVMSGANHVGGIAGRNSGTLSNCITFGDITASSFYAGGITGYSELATGNVIACLALGNVTAVRYGAGAVGYNISPAVISGCFAAGTITSANNVGGLYSFDSGAAATGSWITVPQAKDPSIYIAFDWDFAATWVLPIAMPNIVGQTISAAQNLLSAQGCTLSITSYAYDATVPAGQILTQSIAAGGTAGYPQLQAHGLPASPKTGDVVAVTVSLGDQVEVPNTLGLSQVDAEGLIGGAGFNADVLTATSETVAAGLVMSQSPAGGTNATYQSAVTITISTGHADVIVPNVVGDDIDTAVGKIETAGLLCDVTGAFDDNVSLGFIISQIPDAGVSVTWGNEVFVTMSLGVESAAVPDVVGMTQANATAAITAASLTPAVTTAFHPTIASGTVISQTPFPGLVVVSGTEVDIVVSAGVQASRAVEIVTAPFDMGIRQTSEKASFVDVAVSNPDELHVTAYERKDTVQPYTERTEVAFDTRGRARVKSTGVDQYMKITANSADNIDTLVIMPQEQKDSGR